MRLLAAPLALPLALSLALSACTVEEGDIAGSEAEEQETDATVETIGAVELAAMIERGEVLLVDVRSPQEFAEMHLAGALNAPIATFVPEAIPREEGRETVLYCRSSRRSGRAAEQLAAHLGRRVRHLEGGILAWQEAGLDTIAEPPAE